MRKRREGFDGQGKSLDGPSGATFDHPSHRSGPRNLKIWAPMDRRPFVDAPTLVRFGIFAQRVEGHGQKAVLRNHLIQEIPDTRIREPDFRSCIADQAPPTLAAYCGMPAGRSAAVMRAPTASSILTKVRSRSMVFVDGSLKYDAHISARACRPSCVR
jgi:hypothetical protein